MMVVGSWWPYLTLALTQVLILSYSYEICQPLVYLIS